MIALTLGRSADAAICPEMPPWFEFTDCGQCKLTPLPGVDCASDTTCCVSGMLANDADPDTSFDLCDEAIAFSVLQKSCPTDDFEGHVELFNMDEVSWEDNGLRVCTGDTPFGRHWVAGTYLGAAIDTVGGITRHRASQYLLAAQANSTDFHPQLQHRLSPGLTGVFATSRPDAFGANTIRLACDAFDEERSAEVLGGTFLHEAWHSYYGSHDEGDDPEKGLSDRDHYYAHFPAAASTDIDDEFSPNAWTTDDKPSEAIHTVYQIQHEYYCDLVQSPRNWVPRAGLFAAQARADEIIDGNILSPSDVPGWALCDTSTFPARTKRDPDLPDGARQLEIDLEGVVIETSQNGDDDDTEDFAESYEVLVLPDGNVVVLDETIGQYADGEVWLEIDLNAALASDGETVDFSYNLLFYEDDADESDCDQDLGGDNCQAADDPTLWAQASLDSLTGFYTHAVVLTNETADPGTDLAEITMHVELVW